MEMEARRLSPQGNGKIILCQNGGGNVVLTGTQGLNLHRLAHRHDRFHPRGYDRAQRTIAILQGVADPRTAGSWPGSTSQ